MLIRVPHGLQRMRDKSPSIFKGVIENTIKQINLLISQHPEKKENLLKSLDEVHRVESKWVNEFPLEVWYRNLTPDALPNVQSVLQKMNWIFLTSENKHAFITSDNPVFFFESIGMGKPESQIFFPISSQIVLFLNWHSRYPKSYLNVKDTSIRQINKRIASTATRFVYHSTENPGIASLVNKQTWTFKRLA